MLVLALSMVSCVKQIPVAEQASDVVVVNAFIETGRTADDIFLSSLDSGQGMSGISDARVTLRSEGTFISLDEDPARPGHYRDLEGIFLKPNTSYDLEILLDGERFTSQTITPPSLLELNVSKQYLEVEQDNDLVFLEWEGLNSGSFNEFFYLVTMRPLALLSELEEIQRSPQENELMVINVTYNPELLLSTDFFRYYGNHLIEIKAIRLEHEELFLTQMDVSGNGASNIDGAVGFFVGTSTLATVIEVR